MKKMKNYIKQFLLIAVLAIGFTSCESDDDYKIAELSVGGNVILTTTSIKRVDTNVDVNLKIITKSGVTASKIEIYNNIASATPTPAIPTAPVKLGSKIVDATIVEPTKAKFSSSVLTTGGVFNYPELTSGTAAQIGTIPVQLAIVTTYSDGTTTNNPYVLTVGKVIVVP